MTSYIIGMVEETSIVLANKSYSLRTTVPMSIVRQFDLSTQDRLGWNLEVIDGKMKIIIMPIKEDLMMSNKKSKKRGNKK